MPPRGIQPSAFAKTGEGVDRNEREDFFPRCLASVPGCLLYTDSCMLNMYRHPHGKEKTCPGKK
jgi:hypothetical protein